VAGQQLAIAAFEKANNFKCSSVREQCLFQAPEKLKSEA
jgi:hypothetical protein